MRTRKQKMRQIPGRFSPEICGQIEDAAERLGWSLADVIRECVENDLPKLLDREKKRTKRRTQG